LGSTGLLVKISVANTAFWVISTNDLFITVCVADHYVLSVVNCFHACLILYIYLIAYIAIIPVLIQIGKLDSIERFPILESLFQTP
jgi:hypothetical protein